MQFNRELLKSKGWSEEELEKTGSILESIERTHHAKNRQHHGALFVLLTTAALVGNLFFAIYLIPLFATLDPISILIVTGVVGIAWGLIYAFVMMDLEKLTSIHQYTALIVLSIVSFVNCAIIVLFTKNLFVYPGFHPAQNPYVVAGVYALAFIMPYLNMLVKQRKRDAHGPSRMDHTLHQA